MTEIVVRDRWRVRRFDSMNWTVDEWREPSEDSGRRVAKSADARWFNTGNFFSGPVPALSWLVERHALDDGDGQATPREALAIMRRFADDALAALREAVA